MATGIIKEDAIMELGYTISTLILGGTAVKVVREIWEGRALVEVVGGEMDGMHGMIKVADMEILDGVA